MLGVSNVMSNIQCSDESLGLGSESRENMTSAGMTSSHVKSSAPPSSRSPQPHTPTPKGGSEHVSGEIGPARKALLERLARSKSLTTMMVE